MMGRHHDGEMDMIWYLMWLKSIEMHASGIVAKTGEEVEVQIDAGGDDRRDERRRVDDHRRVDSQRRDDRHRRDDRRG